MRDSLGKGFMMPTWTAPCFIFPQTSYQRKVNIMKRSLAYTLLTLTLAIYAAACARTAQGVVTDTKANTSAVRGAIETLDVKTAIIADKTIDAGAIDVDTFQDKKVVVLRGSVPTDAQKTKAEQIARDHAKGYTIENRLAVVPNK
jgi:osmotically-inducible protein OsmY